MKLTLDNVKAYAIENGYNNLRKRDGKGYYLYYTNLVNRSSALYCGNLRLVVSAIKEGWAFQTETVRLDGVITGLHQHIDQEFIDNYPLNQLDLEHLKNYVRLLYMIDLNLCDWYSKKKWTEYNRLERLKVYCRHRINKLMFG